MNTPTLQIDSTFLKNANSLIHATLSSKAKAPIGDDHSQLALSCSFSDFVETQVLIPILMSLFSSALYDGLKGKVQDIMSSRDLEKVLTESPRTKDEIGDTLSPEARKMLQSELVPRGFTNEDIETLFALIRDVAKQRAAEQAAGSLPPPDQSERKTQT